LQNSANCIVFGFGIKKVGRGEGKAERGKIGTCMIGIEGPKHGKRQDVAAAAGKGKKKRDVNEEKILDGVSVPNEYVSKKSHQKQLAFRNEGSQSSSKEGKKEKEGRRLGI